MGSGNQHSSRPEPPGRCSQPPSRQSSAPRPTARWCWRAHAGPPVPDLATWISSTRSKRPAPWAASTQVSPGAKPAPTTRWTPRSRASWSRESSARTSSMSSLVDTTCCPARTNTAACPACTRPGPASTTTSASMGSVIAPGVDRGGVTQAARHQFGPAGAVVTDDDLVDIGGDELAGQARPDRTDADDADAGHRSAQLGAGELAPSSGLGRRAAGTTQTQRGGDQTRQPDGHQGPSNHLHRGASWNRTSDLTLIRGAL